MAVKANFLVQARWCLNALVGGAALEKIQRHYPEHRIEYDGQRFLFEMKNPPTPEIETDVAVPVTPDASDDLQLAQQAAAKALENTSDGTPTPIVPVL